MGMGMGGEMTPQQMQTQMAYNHAIQNLGAGRARMGLCSSERPLAQRVLVGYTLTGFCVIILGVFLLILARTFIPMAIGTAMFISGVISMMIWSVCCFRMEVPELVVVDDFDDDYGYATDDYATVTDDYDDLDEDAADDGGDDGEYEYEYQYEDEQEEVWEGGSVRPCDECDHQSDDKLAAIPSHCLEENQIKKIKSP